MARPIAPEGGGSRPASARAVCIGDRPAVVPGRWDFGRSVPTFVRAHRWARSVSTIWSRKRIDPSRPDHWRDDQSVSEATGQRARHLSAAPAILPRPYPQHVQLLALEALKSHSNQVNFTSPRYLGLRIPLGNHRNTRMAGRREQFLWHRR